MRQTARQMEQKRHRKGRVKDDERARKMVREREGVISYHGRYLGRSANIFLSTFTCGQLTQTTSALCASVKHMCACMCVCVKCHIKD